MADAANMKKRIFIEAHYLEIGGAEISLIGLLSALDYNQYDVDLFLYDHRGELMGFIPQEVNLLPRNPYYAQMENPLKEVFMNGFIRQAFARLKAKFQYRIWAKRNNPLTPEAYFQYLDNAIMPSLPDMKYLGEYDLAINFIALKNHIPMKVAARRMVTWIHTDLSSVSVNARLELPAWERYDRIVSISPQVTKSFLKVFPSLISRVIEIENILSPKLIRKRSVEFDATPELTGIVNLLSVGRFCHAKNYDNVPDIASRIIKEGVSIKWYLIGFGPDEALIREKIALAKMEDSVIILGKKENPYPYIKACDIYVQPSRYEGKSVTVREAQILCKPVVVTKYPTAISQINHNIDGVIVPMDNAGCAKGIVDFIKNKELQDSIVTNYKTCDFEQIQNLKKFDSLIND